MCETVGSLVHEGSSDVTAGLFDGTYIDFTPDSFWTHATSGIAYCGRFLGWNSIRSLGRACGSEPTRTHSEALSTHAVYE